MKSVALVALVALAALVVGFYVGVSVGERRGTPAPVGETVAVSPNLLAEARGRQFASSDGGVTWKAVVGGEQRELTPAGAGEGRFFAFDKHGIYESRDGGKTWVSVGDAKDAEDLRAHPWKLLNEPQSK